MGESNDNLPVFTVPRSKWYRGQGFAGSRLLRDDDGLRCCLGHVGQQCGVPDDQMLGTPSPHGTPKIEMWPAGLRRRGERSDVNSDICIDMMEVNDDETRSEADRESRLQKLALEAGFVLKFVDDEVTNG